jgi:nucleotide-binding universal stress UspA family protein
MTEINDRAARIVVAQDGSPAARAAAGIAIQVAQARDRPIHGIYVVDEALALDSYTDYHPELDSEREPASRAQLLTWLEEQGTVALQLLEARCRGAGVPVSTEILAGGVVQMVLREAEGAQLLAIGRWGHGHEGDTHHLGRSFRTIAHRLHLPMVVGGDEEGAVRRLLLAYDGSDHARDALDRALELKQALPAEVTVLAVQEGGQQQADEWLAGAREKLGECHCLARQGRPGDEIVAAAQEVGADLIVMGRYRHQALLEWLMGSTVDRVLRGTGLPVLLA